ncbi:MAG: hypothetical protein H7317_19145, partial [Pseudorhodobacter sp.]|nr:hypothetical protein [Pseudorhodobacter sp.]
KIRASTLLALNRPQDALVQLQPLLLADPMNASLTLMHGQSLQALGQSEAARRAYQAVGALDQQGTVGTTAKACMNMLP